MNNLPQVVYSNQLIVTTAQIADAYGTDPKIISKNFNRNKDRYTEGKHYFALEGEELRKFKLTSRQIDDSSEGEPLKQFKDDLTICKVVGQDTETTNQIDLLTKGVNKLYLWTKKGAFLHAKSLNTDKAWEMYELLVDNYFDGQQAIAEPPDNTQRINELIAQKRAAYERMHVEKITIATINAELAELVKPLGDAGRQLLGKVYKYEQELLKQEEVKDNSGADQRIVGTIIRFHDRHGRYPTKREIRRCTSPAMPGGVLDARLAAFVKDGTLKTQRVGKANFYVIAAHGQVKE